MQRRETLFLLESIVDRFDKEKREGVLCLLEPNPEARLLDLGCSDGEFTLKVAGIVRTRNAYGVDIVANSVAKAKAKGIEACQGNLEEKLPFHSCYFDVIVANHVIEHLNNTDTLVREIHRVLKAGAYVIMATPNLAAWYNILCLMLGKQPYASMVSDEILAGTWTPLTRCHSLAEDGPAHRRVFTLVALRELLEHHGLNVERATGIGFFPLPARLARIACSIDGKHASNIVVKARKS